MDESSTLKTPRPASTVIMARENEGELQIYLLKRSSQSNFMPGYYVFPGGTVDNEDKDPALWKGQVDEEEDVAYGVSAIRETFEEAGVFLAFRNEQTTGDLERICDGRIANGLPKGWLRELVMSEGWILAFSRLKRWAHWITPALMPRRFDTRFFLVFMPQDQECIPDKMETTHGIWVSPKNGLAGNLRGEIPLSPPTVVTLHELLSYLNLQDLKKEAESRQWGKPLRPRLIPLPQGAIILEPWDPMIDQEVEIDPKGLENTILPVGKPFSRLWHHEGLWRPVGNSQ